MKNVRNEYFFLGLLGFLGFLGFFCDNVIFYNFFSFYAFFTFLFTPEKNMKKVNDKICTYKICTLCKWIMAFVFAGNIIIAQSGFITNKYSILTILICLTLPVFIIGECLIIRNDGKNI